MKDKIKSIIQEYSSYHKEILAEHTLEEDLGLDSLDIVEMTMSLEEEFDIEITTVEENRLVTVADVIFLIETITHA